MVAHVQGPQRGRRRRLPAGAPAGAGDCGPGVQRHQPARNRALERTILVELLAAMLLLVICLAWWKLSMERTGFVMTAYSAFGMAWIVGRHRVIRYSSGGGFEPGTGHEPPSDVSQTSVPFAVAALLVLVLSVGGIAFGLAATATSIGEAVAVPARGVVGLREAAQVVAELGPTALIVAGLVCVLMFAVVRGDAKDAVMALVTLGLILGSFFLAYRLVPPEVRQDFHDQVGRLRWVIPG